MIQIDIVTPQKQILIGVESEFISLPGSGGALKILEGHADLLTLLSHGELSFKEGENNRRFAISYGFAEIKNNKVTVLAETCEESNEINLERAKLAEKKSKEILSGNIDRPTFRKYELKLERAIVRQRVAV